MKKIGPALVLATSALVASACHDSPQAPPERSEPPRESDGPHGILARPFDLIYVCGNKFLATNTTHAPVHVTYRVTGSSETGSLTMAGAPTTDPAHSETELETVERGVVELYQDNERVAHRVNQGLPCGPSASSSSMAALNAEAAAGQWAAPFPWPVIGIHLHLLPDGKVLTWGDGGDPQVWNPATGDFITTSEPAELFCAGHSFLPDGRLLVAGGMHQRTAGLGIPDVSIFSPGSSSWSRSSPMRRGRWYPTATTLPSGDVLLISGTDQSGVSVEEPEVWSSGGLRVLSGASMLLPNYPRTFVAPNGQVFYAGHQQTTRYLDPTGTGTWITVAERLYGFRDYGGAVMYEKGKILYVGGGRTTNTAEIIDLNSAAPRWQWTGSMAFPRRQLNATVLPTGEVLVTSGSSGTGFNDNDLAVHQAEIWNPNTDRWTILASNTVNRTYHSTSILLPDGRILHSGGEGGGLAASRGAELFSPPYLFKDARPTISAAPQQVGWGTSFTVTTAQAADIAKVSLIRLGSTTHAFDMNQRFLGLPFQKQSGALSITAPANGNVAPPGHYMLFILSADSVPAVAKIVQVGSASDPDPPGNIAPTAAFTQTCNGLTCSFTDGSTDDDPALQSWSWDFDGTGTSAVQNPTHTFPAAASYNVTLTVTDNDGVEDDSTNRVTVTAPPSNAAPTAAFTQTCNGLTCSFTDGSTDDDPALQSWSWDFDGTGTSAVQNPTHTFPAAASYNVTLTVTDNDGVEDDSTNRVTVTAPPSNAAPTAAFTQTCTGLTCKFTDRSTDSDGTIAARRWTFGNGTSSVNRNPSRTYRSAGTYNVTLRVTDNGGATNEISADVTVSSGAGIVLSATGRSDATRQYMTLTWTGARGANVDVYRNGKLLKTTRNDGRDTNGRNFVGPATYVFKVCETGTSVCSNEATVAF